MSQEWKQGLCGCCGDCGTCCCGYCCPCCLTYRNAENLGKSGIVCCLLWDGSYFIVGFAGFGSIVPDLYNVLELEREEAFL